MPTWVIDGADGKTGDEKQIRVTAGVKELAIEKARRLGLLISKVELTESDEESDPHVVDYATPQNADKAESTRTALPAQHQRSAAARILQAILVFFGIILLFVGFGLWVDHGMHGDRFASDNAIGAAANALEVVVVFLPFLTAILLFIWALLIEK
jgi:hypothetical protein